MGCPTFPGAQTALTLLPAAQTIVLISGCGMWRYDSFTQIQPWFLKATERT